MAAATGALLAGSVAAPIIGGLMGQDAARKEQQAADAARQQALAQYANISLPDMEQMKLNLQQYQNAGQLDPYLQQAVQQGDTSLAGISGDPRLRNEQMAALSQIANVAQGNPQAGDLAGFELARQGAAGEMQAKNAQVLQDMAQRGQAGSGAELLAKLKSDQSGAQMLQQAQLQQAQAMQQARMQALQQQASMAGNIRNQDYGEASNLASARDAIARFNAANAQNVQGSNVNAQNVAQAGNLQNRQNVANMNTQTMNNQQISNKQLPQQGFNNQMQLAGAKAGQYGNMASTNDTRAGQQAGMWAGIGQGVSTGLGGIASAYGNKKPTTGQV